MFKFKYCYSTLEVSVMPVSNGMFAVGLLGLIVSLVGTFSPVVDPNKVHNIMGLTFLAFFAAGVAAAIGHIEWRERVVPVQTRQEEK
jgi:hypothetical protein